MVVALGLPIAGPAVVKAQAPNPCGLLTSDEIGALAPKEEISAGVANVVSSVDFSTCRFTWGTGMRRASLEISVNPASRMYVGLSADAIKQGFAASVVPGTKDESISDVGTAAVFRTYSEVYVGATAYVKDRILQVTLDHSDAIDKKGQLIGLLKSAVSRL